MIRLSCNSALLAKTPIDEVLTYYRRIGIGRLELILFMHGPDIEEAPSNDLAALMRRHEMELIALYCRPIDVWSSEKLERSLAVISRTMDIAEDLGVNRIVFPPLLPREKYDYDALIRGCERMMGQLGRRQIAVCLENHHNWPMDLAEDYRRVLGAVADPRLGIAFDTGHFTSSQVDVMAFIDEFAPRILHVHLKDHIGTLSVPLGTGQTDNPAILQKLRQIGYNGCASIELELEDPKDIRQYLADAVRYCQNVLKLD
jgi:sugar phosphate isomerase/epimerase